MTDLRRTEENRIARSENLVQRQHSAVEFSMAADAELHCVVHCARSSLRSRHNVAGVIDHSVIATDGARVPEEFSNAFLEAEPRSDFGVGVGLSVTLGVALPRAELLVVAGPAQRKEASAYGAQDDGARNARATYRNRSASVRTKPSLPASRSIGPELLATDLTHEEHRGGNAAPFGLALVRAEPARGSLAAVKGKRLAADFAVHDPGRRLSVADVEARPRAVLPWSTTRHVRELLVTHVTLHRHRTHGVTILCDRRYVN